MVAVDGGGSFGVAISWMVLHEGAGGGFKRACFFVFWAAGRVGEQMQHRFCRRKCVVVMFSICCYNYDR